ncbi:cytochrome P450 4B1-like [Lethenteron reissneri]|uniref:cytochrome P450 4B1-like n=1 Tax=Lethenteron reissneri TaxID=7753 RepID=UPI002AB67B62|nr:cytochrome P450 4B1-like [Lethenteron reissneri]
MWELLGSLLLLLCAACCALWVLRRRARPALDAFPGPPAHWLYGHAHLLPDDEQWLRNLLKLFREYRYVFPMWFGPFISTLQISHPDYAKAIISTAEPKSDLEYVFIIPWIGLSLLTSSGPRWFRSRRMLSPGFHMEILKPYVSLMVESTQVLIDKWEKRIKIQNLFDVFEDISLMMLDSIMKCAFSSRSSCQTDSDNSYVSAVFDLTEMVHRRSRLFPYYFDVIFNLSPLGYRFRKTCNVAHAHTDKVIKEHKEALLGEEGLEKIKAKRYLDFLDILLSMRDDKGNGLTKEDIQAEVDTFMFAGHDTTASGLAWALHAMAHNPHHQDACRTEVTRLLAGRTFLTWDDLSQLSYTTMCIKESLRLQAVVPAISRKTSKPIALCDGRVIPTGTRVYINIYCLHRNPEFWKDPEVYDPLRFSPENAANRHPYAFIPFSAGPRNCIGQHFAMNELRVTLALILSRFRVLPGPVEAQPVPRLVNRSTTGFQLQLERIPPLAE